MKLGEVFTANLSSDQKVKFDLLKEGIPNIIPIIRETRIRYELTLGQAIDKLFDGKE